MSKFTKLKRNPQLYFYDGFKNFYLKIRNIPKKLEKVIVYYDLEQLNKFFILIFSSLTFVTFSYYYLIGRSKYLVTSSLVVRKTSNNQNPGLSLSSIIGVGNQQSLEDARYVEVYVQSPQVLQDLEDELDFNRAYSKKGLDVFSGIKPSSSRETKYRFFKNQIKVSLNSNSGIIELTTYAFKPEDALKINRFLIKQTEIFVNSLNQEVYKRQLDFGKEQIAMAKLKLDNEIKKLETFQSNYKMLNIEYESKSTLNMIAGLESKLVDLQIKLSDAKRLFLDNTPEIKYLSDQVDILKKQIEKERTKLVSEDGLALNKRSAEINEIKSNISFLKEIYKTTLATSESNRVDSSQQQRFLAILSEPLKPEEEWNYWRHKGFLTYISILIIIGSLGKFILGIADNHRD